MKCTRWFAAATLALFLSGSAALADAAKKPVKEESSFGALRSVAPADAQNEALAWLKAAGKGDAATLKQFQSAWASDRPVLDKVASTLTLGSPEAAALLAEARDADAPAPTEVPRLLKDAKKPAFFRANLTLAYAKALTARKVYEEALEAFAAVKPEDVADPAGYFFHKAVCEHALMLKDRADGSIDRLLVDVTDAPERYRMVAALMHFDMLTWQDKDLGWVARKMDNIQRRLDLKRGGKQTQKIQKEVLVRLDEMIKEMENKSKGSGSGSGNGGNCPNGGDGSSAPGQQNQASKPQDDSRGGSASGKGEVDKKRVNEIAKVWGTLPEKERAQALIELTRGMPAKDRAVIEAYFKELAKKSGK